MFGIRMGNPITADSLSSANNPNVIIIDWALNTILSVCKRKHLLTNTVTILCRILYGGCSFNDIARSCKAVKRPVIEQINATKGQANYKENEKLIQFHSQWADDGFFLRNIENFARLFETKSNRWTFIFIIIRWLFAVSYSIKDTLHAITSAYTIPHVCIIQQMVKWSYECSKILLLKQLFSNAPPENHFLQFLLTNFRVAESHTYFWIYSNAFTEISRRNLKDSLTKILLSVMFWRQNSAVSSQTTLLMEVITVL